ncbi:MAG: hypothetical protein ACMUHY_08955, partial [Thermoplasmatota archaeon]
MAFLLIMGLVLPIHTTGEDDPGVDGSYIASSEFSLDENIDDHRSHFIPNQGQWEEDLLYIAETDFGHVGLGSTSIIYHIAGAGIGNENVVLCCSFPGSDPDSIEAIEPIAARYGFFKGDDPQRWMGDIEAYERIEYNDIWRNIDLIMYFRGDSLKYDLRLRPGSRSEDITMSWEGHDEIRRLDGRTIGISSGPFCIMDGGLMAYYQDDGSEASVEYAIISEDVYSFSVPDRDRSRTLIIDPIIFSSFLGGSGGEVPYAGSSKVESTGTGEILLSGYSSSYNFPTTPGTYATDLSGGYDAFITVVESNGSRIISSTFIGGSDSDFGIDVTSGLDGSVYLTGTSHSDDFPTTEGCYNDTSGGI